MYIIMYKIGMFNDSSMRFGGVYNSLYDFIRRDGVGLLACMTNKYHEKC